MGPPHSLSPSQACTHDSLLGQLQVELQRKDSDGHLGPK